MRDYTMPKVWSSSYSVTALGLTSYGAADLIVTNPPHTRSLMHPLIEHFAAIAPTWLLIDSDLANNQHAAPYLPMCTDIVPIGRGGKWITGSAHANGLNNFNWYRFDAAHSDGPRFHRRGRSPAISLVPLTQTEPSNIISITGDKIDQGNNNGSSRFSHTDNILGLSQASSTPDQAGAFCCRTPTLIQRQRDRDREIPGCLGNASLDRA
jgi:hypothetical protein